MYPGLTEEVCVPIMKKLLILNIIRIFIGYSPERINPGDKIHRLNQLQKLFLALIKT